MVCPLLGGLGGGRNSRRAAPSLAAMISKSRFKVPPFCFPRVSLGFLDSPLPETTYIADPLPRNR